MVIRTCGGRRVIAWRSWAGVSPERTITRTSGSGDALRDGERAQLLQRLLQVLLHVVAERLQRRDVDDVGAVLERAGTQQAVERPEKRRQRLAGAGRSGDQRVATGRDGRPSRLLRRRRRAETRFEPAPNQRRERHDCTSAPHPRPLLAPRGVTRQRGAFLFGETPGIGMSRVAKDRSLAPARGAIGTRPWRRGGGAAVATGSAAPQTLRVACRLGGALAGVGHRHPGLLRRDGDGDGAPDHLVPRGRPVRIPELRARPAVRPRVPRLASAARPPAVHAAPHRRARPDLRRRRRAPVLPLLAGLPDAARRLDGDLRRPTARTISIRRSTSCFSRSRSPSSGGCSGRHGAPAPAPR